MKKTHAYFVSWTYNELGIYFGNSLIYSELRGEDLLKFIISKVTSEVPKAIILSINKLDQRWLYEMGY